MVRACLQEIYTFKAVCLDNPIFCRAIAILFCVPYSSNEAQFSPTESHLSYSQNQAGWPLEITWNWAGWPLEINPLKLKLAGRVDGLSQWASQ